MTETGKGPAAVLSKPGRWLLKLLAGLQPGRSLGRRFGAALGLIALLALFAGLGYGLPAVIAAYNGP